MRGEKRKGRKAGERKAKARGKQRGKKAGQKKAREGEENEKCLGKRACGARVGV